MLQMSQLCETPASVVNSHLAAPVSLMLIVSTVLQMFNKDELGMLKGENARGRPCLSSLRRDILIEFHLDPQGVSFPLHYELEKFLQNIHPVFSFWKLILHILLLPCAGWEPFA